MRDEGLYLDDIIDAAEQIKKFIANVTEDEFHKSELLKSAVLQKLSVIGEAASHVSTEVKASNPQVNWKAITGLRHIAVHAYFSIKWDVIWETTQQHIDVLREQIIEIVESDFPNDPERDDPDGDN